MSTIKYNRKSFGYCFILVMFLMPGSCKKYVQISPPPNQLQNANVFNNDASAVAAITGIYSRMTSSGGFASGAQSSVTQSAGLSADEFVNYQASSDWIQFVTNNLSPTNGTMSNSLWAEPYQYIYTANVILEGLAASSATSDSVKSQIRGEAKFVRAFCYFYLTNLFGDVPLYTSSNYQTNSVSTRTPAAEVVAHVISDLKDAKQLMSPYYLFSAGEKIRPNRWTASALLARTYLYEKQWDSAKSEATSVIQSGAYTLMTDLNSVFLANSDETIWQLLPTQPGQNTFEGSIFILTAAPTYVSMTDTLVHSFEPGDLRFTDWVGSYSDGTTTWFFPYKYKVQTGSNLTEYSMVFRYAEQFLIRAEAETMQSDFSNAASDLNTIRTRAGLPNTAASDMSSLMAAIQHERQIELFSEWGHRWLDLKRTGTANAVLGPFKGPSWQPTDTLYPIPSTEINTNPHITQNPGY